jgi:hypothetical protein
MTILHKDIRPVAGDPLAGNHVLHYYTFNDVASMNAGTDALLGPVVFAANDVGKVARVGLAAPFIFYVLVEHTTPSWSPLGVIGNQIQVPGTSNEDTTVLGSEVVVGGFYFDGSTLGVLTATLRMVGILNSVTPGADLDLLLYDMGAPGVPGPGVLRSTITMTAQNVIDMVDQALTPTGAPGVNVNQIFNSPRLYELRLLINSVTPGDSAKLHYGGLALA